MRVDGRGEMVDWTGLGCGGERDTEPTASTMTGFHWGELGHMRS